jgi:RNA polymerase sigma-70 factor (ECF subfamily)
VRELVILAREGDHAAYSELATRSIGRLTAAARMILRDEHRAQDAVQDTLVEAWRSLPGLRDPDRWDAWLHRLLVRACHGRARREWRHALFEHELTPADEPLIPDATNEVVLHDQLERGLSRLSTEQRTVLVLAYYLDMPLAEAAQVAGIPVGTMKSRLNRATHALRAVIDADDRAPIAMGERVA